jgi:hypothetical protein
MADSQNKSNSEAIKILSSQLGEQNQFARTNIQLLVQWFIFFATANYVVIGYFVLKMADAPLNRPAAFYWVAALFVSVNIIASVLCWHARIWFARSATAAEATLRRIQQLADSPSEFVAAPPPYHYYAWVAVLMGCTVLTMLLAWIAIVSQTRNSRNTAHQQQVAPIQVYCFQGSQTATPGRSSSSRETMPTAFPGQIQVFCTPNTPASAQPPLPSPIKPSPKQQTAP